MACWIGGGALGCCLDGADADKHTALLPYSPVAPPSGRCRVCAGDGDRRGGRSPSGAGAVVLDRPGTEDPVRSGEQRTEDALRPRRATLAQGEGYPAACAAGSAPSCRSRPS
jgi:hypothetical protein